MTAGMVFGIEIYICICICIRVRMVLPEHWCRLEQRYRSAGLTLLTLHNDISLTMVKEVKA